MSKATGSSASMERMQNMITQVNNNGDGNGDLINPHIPPGGDEIVDYGSLPTFNVVLDKESDTISTSVGEEKKARSIKRGKLKQRFKQMKIGKRVKDKFHERKMARDIKKGASLPDTKKGFMTSSKKKLQVATLPDTPIKSKDAEIIQSKPPSLRR
jgi:hypothetical protein